MTLSKPAHGSTGWDTATNAVIDAVNGLGDGANLAVRTLGDDIQKIGVPLYIFPDYTSTPSVWNTIAAAAPASRFTIANPNTGPGTSSDIYYVEQIKRMQASGVFMLGYVSTHYASVAYATVMADVANWVSWYNVDGIFLDETSSNSDQAHYQSIYDAIKAIDPNLIVVCNPGVGVDVSMEPTADVFMSFEGTPTDYRLRPSVNAPAWERTQPAWRFWHLVHSVASVAEAREVLNLSSTYRAGTVFVTDRTMPNPWLGLPTIDGIWQEQLDRARPAADHFGVVNVQDYGAVGDGTTDDSAAFTAAYNAAVAALTTGWSGGVGSGEDVGRVRIWVPPGRYKIVTPEAMMSSTALATPATGITWHGAGKRVSEILFQPTVGFGSWLLINNDSWRGVDFADLTFLSGTSGAGFMLSNSTGFAQDYRFQRCEWDGSWSYGFQLLGTNNNSEMLWDQCTVHGSYSQAFLYAGTHTGTTVEDQFLNYWFTNCKVEFDSGTFLCFPRGGNINCVGGSYISTGTGVTFFSMPDDTNDHFDGVQRLYLAGIRFEARTLSDKILDCHWRGGTVHVDSCVDTAYATALSGIDTLVTYDFATNGQGGPAVLFTSCDLVGQHRYTYNINDYLFRPTVKYDSCNLRSWNEPQQFVLTPAGSGVGVPGSVFPIEFVGCRGGAFIGGVDPLVYPPDQTVNWSTASMVQPKRRAMSFKGPFNLPYTSPAGGTTLDMWLPLNALVTGVRFFKPAGSGSSTSTSWVYTVQTSEGTPTSLASVAGGGTVQWGSGGFNTTTAVNNFWCNSDAKRHLQLIASGTVDQTAADSLCIVEYYG